MKVKLKDVAESINAGGTPRRNVKEYWENGDIPWLKISDLKSVYISESQEKITKKGLENSSAKLFPKGTVLFSIFATLGAAAILKKASTTNQAIAGILPNKELIDTKYLYYSLKAEKKRITAKKTHATQDNINLTILRNHEILLPPLEIQKDIVSILEKAEQLKQWRKEADKLTSDYLYSVFLEMFGDPIRNPKNWNIRKLGDVCTSITDGPHVSPNYVEKGIPFISVHNIINGFFDLSDIKYISREDHERFCRRSKPERGDVLYSKGGTTGFAKRIDVDFEFSIWVHLALLKFSKELLDPIFLETCLNSNYCKTQAKRLTRGIANKDLVLSQMARVRIIVPPIGLQKGFSEVIDQVEHIKNYQKQTGWQIDDLYNTLMQKAFRGELNC